MTVHTAKSPNYQALAAEFSVGDVVVPLGGAANVVGRVVAVFPAIGMVDVELPTGITRQPVEDLIRLQDSPFDPPATSSPQTVSVPGGPFPFSPSTNRVAAAYLKQSLYWAEVNRRYRATQGEHGSKCYSCPRCAGSDQESQLRMTAYERKDGRNVKLYVCPQCMWAIKPADLIVPEVV